MVQISGGRQGLHLAVRHGSSWISTWHARATRALWFASSLTLADVPQIQMDQSRGSPALVHVLAHRHPLSVITRYYYYGVTSIPTPPTPSTVSVLLYSPVVPVIRLQLLLPELGAVLVSEMPVTVALTPTLPELLV